MQICRTKKLRHQVIISLRLIKKILLNIYIKFTKSNTCPRKKFYMFPE